jgi:hypothetical protein
VLQNLQLAQKFGAFELLEASFKYFDHHKEEIVYLPQWKKLNSENPELVILATQRMCSKKRKLEHGSVSV